MSKGILSKRGLKYTLSDSVYEQVMNIDQGTNILWNKLDTVVEYAEIFSDFCAFVSFVVLATVTELNWIEIVGYSLLAYLVGTVLSNCVWVFRGIILPIFLFCFQLLTKYFLHFIIVILLSIFAIKIWWVGLAFIAAQFILSVALTMLIGSYAAREQFNNRAALALMRSSKK